MSEEKKIEYVIDVKHNSLRVRYKFDFKIPEEQMNFPIGTDEETIVEALKNRYDKLKEFVGKPKEVKTGTVKGW